MTDQTANPADFLNNADRYYSVTDTFWGYIIGPPLRAKSRASLGELLAVLGSLAFGGVAFALWLMPGANDDPLLVPFKIGMTAIFFVLAGMLYQMAKKGLAPEVQVDLHEKELRLVRRNLGGESVVLDTYAFDRATDVRIHRSRYGFSAGSLGVQIVGLGAPVLLATGSEPELAALRARVADDLGVGAVPAVVQGTDRRDFPDETPGNSAIAAH